MKRLSLKEVLQDAEQKLCAHGLQRLRRALRSLFAALLVVSPVDLILQSDRLLTIQQVTFLSDALVRLMAGEPWQYIAGKVFFYNSEISVDHRVLIPRFETEYLVDIVVKQLSLTDSSAVLDLCCGSGCIAIALKKALPGLVVYGADLSPSALEVAKKNGLDNCVEVEWLLGDLAEPLAGKKFDLCLCNPPYIRQEDIQSLEATVRDHEPYMALDGGRDGLRFYRRFVEEMRPHLAPQARCFFEIGFDQASAVVELFSARGLSDVRVIKDFAGLDRIISLVWE